MLIKTIFSGFGGQGVMSMGYIFAYAAMVDGRNVTYLPSYGAEVRGGTANCTIAISDDEIASPVASSPEFVVVMNNPSLVRFQNTVQSGGIIFLNANMIDARPIRGDIELFEIPANDLAKEVGSERVVNMVMLGFFVKKTGLVSREGVEKALKDTFSPRGKALVALNKKAFMEGHDYD
jgi:2-oxoglutarate ferredoxin oxidoreductase subunit gamma